MKFTTKYVQDGNHTSKIEMISDNGNLKATIIRKGFRKYELSTNDYDEDNLTSIMSRYVEMPEALERAYEFMGVTP